MTQPLRLSLRKKILFALTINLGFFVVLEATIRVAAFFAYDRSPYFLFYGVKAFMGDDSREGHSVVRDGYFKFQPSQIIHQYGLFLEPTPIRINAAGFRGPDFEAVKPPGVLRIACLGGSSTFGFYNRDDYTYPAILQRPFAQERPARGSVPSTSSTQESRTQGWRTSWRWPGMRCSATNPTS